MKLTSYFLTNAFNSSKIKKKRTTQNVIPSIGNTHLSKYALVYGETIFKLVQKLQQLEIKAVCIWSKVFTNESRKSMQLSKHPFMGVPKISDPIEEFNRFCRTPISFRSHTQALIFQMLNLSFGICQLISQFWQLSLQARASLHKGSIKESQLSLNMMNTWHLKERNAIWTNLRLMCKGSQDSSDNIENFILRFTADPSGSIKHFGQ